MTTIRVLVVDDSVVIRRLVTDILTEDSSIEVAGTAPNGKIALQKISQVNPDVVTLDIEMPEMDGVETLRAIRVEHPRLPVIMFSTLTERGAAVTIEALSAGASDYVCKPANVGSVTAAKEQVRSSLIPKIKALCPKAIKSSESRPTAPRQAQRTSFVPPKPMAARPAAASRVDIVAIGVSTGGPNALAELFRGFTSALPVPMVVVQHMPPMFTAMLAERLNAQSALTTCEAGEGMVLHPGHAYIAPGDYHMVLATAGAQVKIVLNQEPPENSCRPAVDPLLRSVAKLFHGRSLAVILTGMGRDGHRGCQHIRESGGQIVCQDEESSVVWGMPGYVTQDGLADAVLPIGQIAEEIVQRCSRNRHGFAAQSALRTDMNTCKGRYRGTS